MWKKISPALALLFIAPILGELVSGHQAPVEFFNPLTFLILAFPYGFGALICRELMIRWKTGRLGLIFLGLAYGVYEEALVVRSVFNPDWLELGELSGYGHALGINWTYTQMLFQFHVLISIYASILLAELLYPAQRQQRWLGNKGLIACSIGLLLWLPVGFLLTDYMPETIYLLLSVIGIMALLSLAYYLPTNKIRYQAGSTAKPGWFFWLGLSTISLSFIAVGFTPEWQNPPPVFGIFIFVIAVNVVSLYLMIKWSRSGIGWDDRQRLSLLSGLLGFFLVSNVFADLESFQGLSLVTLLMIWALLRLRKNVYQKYNAYKVVLPSEH